MTVPKSDNEACAANIIAGMAPWFESINVEPKRSDGRTLCERKFDSGVFVAMEFVRRYTGDEQLAALILGCCTFNRVPPTDPQPPAHDE